MAIALRDLMSGKRVLVRVDLMCRSSAQRQDPITDDTRIRESLPTINYLREPVEDDFDVALCRRKEADRQIFTSTSRRLFTLAHPSARYFSTTRSDVRQKSLTTWKPMSLA